MNTRRLPLLLMALSVACKGANSAGEGGTGWLAGAGKPVNLALTFEPENGEVAVITPFGGSISTTGEDGTHYRLDIPEGALLYDERISMIPVSSVKNLPLKGGSIAAVHLKPEGLRLLKPATLRIRPRTSTVPLSEQVAYAYFANGKDAHLYPILPDTTTDRIHLPIFHFSGYGFGQAPSNDPGRIALQYAADKEARLSARLAQLISEGRNDPDFDLAAVLVPHFIQYYKEVLRPLMKTAETDERMAPCALQRLNGWQRQMALLGLEGDESGRTGNAELDQLRAEAEISGQRIIENRVQKMLQRVVRLCREEHDFYGAMTLLAMEREAILLGHTIGPGLDHAREQLDKCMSFELEFDSRIVTKTPSGGETYHVHARVPIEKDVIGTTLARTFAQAPIRYKEYDASGNPKEDLFGKGIGKSVGSGLLEILANVSIQEAGTRESICTVHGVSLKTRKKEVLQTNCQGVDEDAVVLVTDTVKVTLSPGMPQELVRYTRKYAIPGAPSSEIIEQNGWLEQWQMFRRAQQGFGAEEISEDLAEERRRQLLGMVQEDDPLPEVNTNDLFVFELAQESPGVWSVRFKVQEKPVLGGFARSEDTRVILRHTPK